MTLAGVVLLVVVPGVVSVLSVWWLSRELRRLQDRERAALDAEFQRRAARLVERQRAQTPSRDRRLATERRRRDADDFRRHAARIESGASLDDVTAARIRRYGG